LELPANNKEQMMKMPLETKAKLLKELRTNSSISQIHLENKSSKRTAAYYCKLMSNVPNYSLSSISLLKKEITSLRVEMTSRLTIQNIIKNN
jgi:hypothetical protein